jgi:hypothetical protein
MSQSVILRHRRGTAAEWLSADPILEDGQIGFETDTVKWKLGNGVDVWTDLDYAKLNAPITRGAAWNMSDGTELTAPFPPVIVYFPREAVIHGVSVLTASGNGSCEIDITVQDYTDFPSAGTSIVASAPPTISGARKYRDTTLTGWTTVIPAESILTFTLVSSSSFKSISVSLDIEVLNNG